ncbi:DUF1702 family protein [Roseibium album]|uniref:DUF1702 family protein n=1 Tax=Roseibium album TaxID=311410 RepID=UPI003BB171B4
MTNSNDASVAHYLHNSIGNLFLKSNRIARLSTHEAKFKRRGFEASDPERQALLETIGVTFIEGYNEALSTSQIESILNFERLIDRNHRGFYLEGAAMGCAVADGLPWSKLTGFEHRLSTLLKATSDRQPYLTVVGAGWAMARISWRRSAILAAIDHFIASLAFDGWGFHDIYFQPSRLKQNAGRAVRSLGGALAARSWDQGAGRALWFTSGGNVQRACDEIYSQGFERQADLFAGLGLAMTYACGATVDELQSLRSLSGAHAKDVAQGSAFALEAHECAATTSAEARNACRILTGKEPEEAIRIVKLARPSRCAGEVLSLAEGQEEYEKWRSEVRANFVL